MRLGRFGLLLLGIYIVFLGGSAYYNLVFPVRVFHHLAVTLLLAAWLIGRLRKRQGLPATPLNKPIYALVGVWVVSAAASLDPRMAFEHLWFLLVHVLFFLFLAETIRRGRQRMLMDAQFLIAALVVFVTGIELASWYFGLGITPGTSIGWADVTAAAPLPLVAPRVSLAMNISTLLAGYVAPLLAITLVWALTAHRQYRAPLVILAVGLLIVLVLTFSRGGLLSFAAAAGVFILFRMMQSQRLTQLIPVPVMVGAAVIAAVIVVGYVVGISATRRSGDEGRLDMWQGALQIASDHPVLGVGPGLYGRAFRTYRSTEYVQDKLASAHNVYLNTLAETGIVGLIAAAAVGVAFLRAWWQNWRQACGGRKIRLEGVFAALVGVGIHSMVDTFTITPIVLLIVLLAAYAVMKPREGFEVIPTAHPATAGIAVVAVVAYGMWFAVLDMAQSRYQQSLGGGDTALENAEAAVLLDLGLRLYDLQIAYLHGQQDACSAETLDLYTQALTLEPTWETGWINFAALTLRQQDDGERALAALDHARQLKASGTAPLHWARLAEARGLAADEAIIESYVTYLKYHPVMAFSAFWQETALRQQALIEHVELMPIDYQYRVYAAQFPERAAALIPDAPQAAAEWWVAGQAALERGDHEAARAGFDRAIGLRPTVGDYYVSRAESMLDSDPDAARLDLQIATLLGTTYTQPNAVLARLAATDDERRQLLAAALPPKVSRQEFAAVMYDRPSAFDLLPEMRDLGRGRAAMQPWYELAEQYLSEDDSAGAINVYRAILDYAPDEQEAADALVSLGQPPAAPEC